MSERIETPCGAEVFYGHWWPKLLGVWGFTWGKRIYFDRAAEKVTEAMVKHECVHVRQFEKYGKFGFSVLYLWESLKVFSFYDNSFEVEARLEAGI